MEGTDAVLINGGAVVARAQLEDLDLCVGRRTTSHLEMTPPPPSGRLHLGQPDSARQCIGVPIAVSHELSIVKTEFAVFVLEQTFKCCVYDTQCFAWHVIENGHTH